ncbi:hypothetical protein POM88_038092 [Heracleum sosnowskyi]|uniref:Uncharacterized protein n=1 Tax=Heracleum sosnowskyi TaxID=360622 RepID=A0AAD8MDV5_9APIA|nr:hypothetical protein POM88_038092 [Heracleum sosnowskyi]
MANVQSMDSKTNFERLLWTLTPTVRSRSIPKNYVEGWNKLWNPVGKPITRYFSLGDLWHSFETWSACGVGTRVENHDSEDVVHYFVPKLSALQIFTTKSVEKLRIPKVKDGNDIAEVDAEAWSEESDGEKSPGTASNNSSNAWEITAEDIENENIWPLNKNFQNLYFGLQDSCPPYYRPPLFERILPLVEEYPGLLTLKSTDLTPASWMAISWYPIYQIPAQEIKDDMASPFLTFHTISSFFQDDEDVVNGSGTGSKLTSLPPFGIASYKLEGDIWFCNEGSDDHGKFYALNSAADSWLKQVNFNHYDFKHFNSKAAHVCKDECDCRGYRNFHRVV